MHLVNLILLKHTVNLGGGIIVLDSLVDVHVEGHYSLLARHDVLGHLEVALHADHAHG